MAAVKISSARPKAAQKFWAPQQVIAAAGKSTSSPEGTKPFYFNGAFFILAQVRGNWGGVSFTLRMITTRWVTSVPGMV